ncbi:MAG TPA: hypothetical protein VGO04_31200 [Ensifer sp.]|jgi:hypothetical protein|uniref:hypothetical protein n=1 Tax=Ensifer sp. TaxID=1872086 RepID=UPI002E11A18A|nr:hypothetical protein [Ensifer sp.]
MFREIGLYLVASPRSRIWQLQDLRELDAERLADVGISEGEAYFGRRKAIKPLLRADAMVARHAEAVRAGAL